MVLEMFILANIMDHQILFREDIERAALLTKYSVNYVRTNIYIYLSKNHILVGDVGLLFSYIRLLFLQSWCFQSFISVSSFAITF